MNAYNYIDIETIPDQTEGALDRAKEGIKVPGNYKNPEVIKEYIDANAQDAWEKTALDGLKGHVVAIVLNDVKFFIDDVKKEKKNLEMFFSHLDGGTLVGHNIIGFDIPFLTKRALVLGVELPIEYKWPRNLKPWDKTVFDTMLQFDAKNWISLDNLAKSLGIKGKGDASGSQVNYMWQQGLYQEIADYCHDDVRIVREIHKRFIQCKW